MKIPPFNPADKDVASSLRYILHNAPVQNLTEEEVLTTIRLLQLEIMLQDTERSKYRITIYADDARLTDVTDEDRFLAALLHTFYRGELLQFKLLRYLYGNTDYHWRKIMKKCVIIETSAQTVEGKYGGRFLGKGWVLAKHIKTLRSWIIENSKNEEFKKLSKV